MKRGLAIAGLVIVLSVVAVFLLPYLHHRAYPDAVRDHWLESKHPPFPREARVDELGSANRIRSEADALTYIQALFDHWAMGLFRGFDENRLARAEYAAVRDPQKRIPESLVVKTFNALVDKWGAPRSIRVTVEELHAFRAEFMYPQAAGCLPDGSYPRDFRPAEAVYMLDQLYFNGGVPGFLRVRFSTTAWLRSLLPAFRTSHRAPGPQLYAAAWQYYRWHPSFTSQRQFSDDLFRQLGIN